VTADAGFAALGVARLAAAFAQGACDPFEALAAYVRRIERHDPGLNAYVALRLPAARAEAQASAARWRAGAPRSAIDGVPFAVKANIAVAGLPFHGGIAAYRNQIAGQDAEIVAALKRLGAVPLGIVNMHEGALGATTDNPHFGRTGNPFDLARTPGGSSGGSAAAVAAGLAAFALGTDTMGSVRIPSAYCGVAGMKPSKGLLPDAGLLALSPTLDHVGLHAPGAADLAAVLAAVAKVDAAPPARIGVLDWGAAVGVESGVQAAFAAAADRAATFAPTSRVELGERDLGAIRRKGLIISEIEGYAVHREALARDRAGFSDEFAGMLEWGARLPGDRIAAARADVAAAAARFARLFDAVDVVLTPTAPQGPFAFGDPVPDDQADFTCIANFGGFPALAIPASREGAPPFSVQFIAPRGGDRLALGAALAFEAARGPAPRPAAYFHA
jgi:aspartyl-tRNA(Asn)/glutamyl-tRNA(Gln) amidotransferase subunit A